MSHTQGPWALNRYGDVICSTGEIVQAEGFAIPGISRPETRANRNLMSAAPEMLAALEAVLSVADRATVEFDLARTAIAKAKGATK
jgi:GTPase Era involved in 16S rRNA processing